MRYLDTGSRDPAESLGAWFQSVLAERVSAMRVQTGFFTLNGLAPLLDVMELVRESKLNCRMLVGSNDGSTLKNDVLELALRMGIPRSNASLGVVSFRGSFFHPKVYHFERADGSQVAYVGSANLTSGGLELHCEAGIALDSRDDGATSLTRIASEIDRWFLVDQVIQGVTYVEGVETIDRLAEEGVLSIAAAPRVASVRSASGSSDSRPVLTKLLGLTGVPRLISVAVVESDQNAVALPNQRVGDAERNEGAAAGRPDAPLSPGGAATTRPGFPPYLFFRPQAVTATFGPEALTGSALPSGAVGLIVKLNRDSARHFDGRSGTANISLPVATAFTLRFGVSGVHQRPATEFDLWMRWLAEGVDVRAESTRTSVSGYGYTGTESGHGDIRLVVTAEARRLKDRIIAASGEPPREGDLAMLEWPTSASPCFKLTFVQRGSPLYQAVAAIYLEAENMGELVGTGACWLPASVAPLW